MRPKVKKPKYQKVYKVTKIAIKGFFEDHRFLSNHHLCSIWFEGREYPSTENAYQASKFPDNLRKQFQDMSPVDAKSLGNKLKMSDNELVYWDRKRIDVMAQINMYKFSAHPDIRKLLLDTDGKLLVEENYWGDVFWGMYKSKGDNNLGKILMKVRSFWLAIENQNI